MNDDAQDDAQDDDDHNNDGNDDDAHDDDAYDANDDIAHKDDKVPKGYTHKSNRYKISLNLITFNMSQLAAQNMSPPITHTKIKSKFKTGHQIIKHIKITVPSNQQSRDGGTSSADPRHPGTCYKIVPIIGIVSQDFTQM